jgi:23S rRNA (uracil1939-C5)-methyltransferase
MNASAAAHAFYDVTSLSHDGRGVARADGKALFITGALPGERVSVRALRRHRSYDEATLDSLECASPSRVTPRCAHFGVCGGCSLQHLEPGAQIAAKQEHLLEEFRRTARVEPATLLPALTGTPWGYRRRARLGARFVAKKDRVVVGFRERAAPYVADLKRCEILAPPLGGLIEPLGAMLTGLGIRARIPQIEVAVADNATALVFRVLSPPAADDVAQMRAFGEEFGVQIYVQPGGTDSVTPLGDSQPLRYRLPDFDIELIFGPTDFVQVNGELNRSLVTRAIELLTPQPAEEVLDLFCGIGNFTLPLARHCACAVGVEGESGLIERARANADANRIENVQFYRADLAVIDGEPPWARRTFARVLLDPPRAGARAALPLIDRCGAARVVYISCHAGSLARDAGILVHDFGFRLESAGVIDMFPHTSHVESVAVFER